LPLRSADRSTTVHAQRKISAECFFCGNFVATPCHLMFGRRADVRGRRSRNQRPKCSAVAIAPQKNLILPQEKLRKTLCLRFAARLAHAVNVRAMREMRIKVKCFPRRRISCRTTRRRFRALPANAPQAIERTSEFPWPPGRLLAPHRSSACIDMVFRNERRVAKPRKLDDCLQFAAACLVLAARLRVFARHSRVVSQCALSASTRAGFCPDAIPQS
jgi:hypothetical protein